MDIHTGRENGDSDGPKSFQDVESVCTSPPKGVAELKSIVQLVQRLYQPGMPQEITRIQQTLQNIQRSREGWALADALLQSHDDKVRFFGALTFTIKINIDWYALSPTFAMLLTKLQEFLGW